jgi:hypothetical protein
MPFIGDALETVHAAPAAAGVPHWPADASSALDASIRAVEKSLASAAESSKLAARPFSALARSASVLV